MATQLKGKKPQETSSQLLAVWPGMGHVALTAGLYLMSKLQLREEAPVATGDLFDLDHVDVDHGLAKAGHTPVSHLYVSQSLPKANTLGLVIGEAQPPLHKLEYCRRILDGAARLGAGRVVTFAALAVDALPREASRVFGVATDAEGLAALRRHRIQVLEAGQIQGMNGVFLAAAAQRGIPGLCLLGSMPTLAARIPYPKASHAVLQAFVELSGLSLDLAELQDYGRSIEQQLTEGIEKIQEALQQPQGSGDAGAPLDEPMLAEDAAPQDRQRIEQLFEKAMRDRSRAFELKRELDRQGVFKDYENRFLDLFRRPP